MQSAEECRLSTELARLAEASDRDGFTFEHLFEELGYRGHALLTLVMSFPFCTPIPLPGVGVIFGMVIFIAGIRIALGLGPWLPQVWLKRKLPGPLLAKAFRKAERVMKRVENLIKPRGAFLKSRWMRPLTGMMLSTCGILLSLPLPPGTNFPPALPVVLLSIGLLEADGIVISLGYFAFAAAIAFFVMLFRLGIEGIKIWF